jgi:hypothetical protein
MNENQIKGTAKDIAGKVQETAGEIVGSNKQQAKGLAKQVEGRRCAGRSGRRRGRQPQESLIPIGSKQKTAELPPFFNLGNGTRNQRIRREPAAA